MENETTIPFGEVKYGLLMEEKVCTSCGLPKQLNEFTPLYRETKNLDKTRNVCKKCKHKSQMDSLKRSPERLAISKGYFRAYHEKHRYAAKVKSYRVVDKKKGRGTITLDEFRVLFEATPQCFYCKETNKNLLGLDRKDNTKGHEPENVVVCCEKCNDIFSDIPFEAKVLLSEGMQKVREQGILTNWTVKLKRRVYGE